MKWYLLKNLFFIIIFLMAVACQKANENDVELEVKTFEFGIVGQIYPGIKDETKKTLDIVIPQELDKTKLTAFYSSSTQAAVMINHLALTSKETVADYSQPVQIQVMSNNNTSATTWTVNVRTETEALGLGTFLNASKSISSTADYYIDQRTTGTYASVNCGPTVSTMAAKWADPQFSKSVTDARNEIKTSGGGWSTNDVISYLKTSGINTMTIYFSNIEEKIKKCIDRNYEVIVCLDMYYIDYNTDKTQQTGKFYTTNHKSWGHFILIKGYKMVDGKMYLEVYDPNSGGALHPVTKQPMGKNRYYAADQIKLATENWWKYAIVVAPKGQKVDLCEKAPSGTDVPSKDSGN
ncbi:MAG: hypothetical protein ACKOW2_04595 [Sphingobacteriaceae bacterium]